MRDPVSTTLSEEEKELVDAAVLRSGCRSRSEFIRSASVLVAGQLVPEQDEGDEDDGEDGDDG